MWRVTVLMVALCICLSSSLTFARMKLRPYGSASTAVTPSAAVSVTRKDVDFYSSVGGGVKMEISQKWEADLSYFFGLDRVADITESFSSPGLTIGYFLTPNMEERLKMSAGVSHSSGYFYEKSGLGTYFFLGKSLGLELTPQLFVDSANTRQYEMVANVDLSALPVLGFNLSASVGRAHAPGLPATLSYSFGGGTSWSVFKRAFVMGGIDYSHGLNTATPYHVINTSGKVSSQGAGERGNAALRALDPSRNTFTFNLGGGFRF